MKTIWSPEAIDDFEIIVDYLIQEWSKKSAEKFSDLVFEKIKLIKKQAEIFESSFHKDVRKAPITNHVTLFYIIRNTELVLLRFWNNAQNPENLSL